MDTYILRSLAVLTLLGGPFIALNPVVVDTWREGHFAGAVGLFLSVWVVLALVAGAFWALSRALVRYRERVAEQQGRAGVAFGSGPEQAGGRETGTTHDGT